MSDEFIILEDDGRRTRVNPHDIVNIIILPNDSEGTISPESEEIDHVVPLPDDILLERVDALLTSCGITIAPSATNEAPSTSESELESPELPTTKSKVKVKQINCSWKKEHLQLTEDEINFKGNNSLPKDFLELDTPFQVFSYFLDDKLYETIIEQTQIYSAQKDPNKPLLLKKSTLQTFLGICIISSIIECPIRDLWDSALGIPIVKDTMGVNTFEKIRSLLHFNDNLNALPRTQPEFDELYKLRPIINYLNEKFLKFPMDEILSVDEQMCSSKTRHRLRQYMPNKPHKWGYKLFAMCDRFGFAYKFEIYTGRENAQLNDEPDLGASSNVVVRLSREVPMHQNFKIYADNYYTSVPLAVYLKKRGIFFLGTVRRNRIPQCKNSIEKDILKKEKGYTEEFCTTIDGCKVSSVVWKDSKYVHLLSTLYGTDPMTHIRRYDKKMKIYKQIECPQIIKAYNKHMGGVDLMDSHIGRYKISMNVKKRWYMRLFYHLLDMTIVNSWIMYLRLKQETGSTVKMTQKQFRKEIGEVLCNIGRSETPKRGRPSREKDEEHLRKKKSASARPSADTRKDGTDHWPQWDSKRNRCQDVPRNIGFIGLGNMGSNMCKNLIKKGFGVMVKDISKEREASMAHEGARIAKDMKDIGDFANYVITMLPASQHLVDLYQSNGGLLRYLKKGTTAVDCSTVDYTTSMSLGKCLYDAGITFIDSPVSGGVPAADKGTLTFMVGGEKSTLQEVEPLLMAMGSKIFHCGPLGSGQITKMCNNLLLAISVVGVSEIFNLGMKLGIKPKLLTTVINHSSGRCWVTETYHPVPKVYDNVPSSNQYKAGFTAEMILKDLKIAEKAASEVNCSLNLGSIVSQLYSDICKTNQNGKDFTYIYKHLQDNEKKSK